MLDRFLMILETTNLSSGPMPFLFTNHLLNDDDFNKNIETCWKNTSKFGHPSYFFMRRLKQINKHI